MSKFSASIRAMLETSEINHQLADLSKRRVTLEGLTFNSASLINNIQNALNHHQFTINMGSLNNAVGQQMQQAGQQAGQRFVNNFSAALNNIHLQNGGIGNITRMLQGAGFNKSSIASITNELDRMVLTINKLTTRQLNNGDIRMTISGIDELNRAVQIVREFDRETGIVRNTNKSFTQEFDTGAEAVQRFNNALRQGRDSLNNGSLTASISTVTTKYEELGSTGHSQLTQIGTDIELLRNLQVQMQSATNDEDFVNAYRKFNQVLTTTKNNLTVVANESKRYVSQIQIDSLQNKMEVWMQKNPRALKQYGSSIQGYIQQLKSMSATDTDAANKLNALSDAFKRVDQSATLAGLKGATFTSTFKKAFQSITRYVGTSTIIYAAFNSIRKGITSIIDLDTELVDLRKTTDATEAELKTFYFTSNDIAKHLGVTTKEVIQATSSWSRLGYSIKDAQTMAKTSSIFAAISPGMNIDVATDGLVSAMKAFDIEAEDALDGIASKINAIGNTQAVNNQDIVDFLTRSSSAMKEANNTLEETIALGTAATEITRDANSVGNALKTVSMRIRGYDEETEEYIGGIEELSGKIADVTKTASAPHGISLFTDETKSEYKSTVQLLRDIAKIYNELTDKQQAGLLEALAGKRQGQIVAAILNNFKTVEDSLETMKNSTGSAMREMEIIEESLQYKLNALKETGVGIFQNLFDAEGMGAVISGLNAILNIIDFLTKNLGLLGTAIASVGIVSLIKNFD